MGSKGIGGVNTVVGNVCPLLEKRRGGEELELEFRLGVIQENRFDPVIPKAFFEKIKNKLDNSKCWKDTKIIDCIDKFHNGMRLSEHEDGTKVCIKKEKIFTSDWNFKGTPFDVRICLSKEQRIPQSKFRARKNLYIRKKKRFSYIYKNWSYDLSIITMENNGVEETKYEIELEIMDTNEMYKALEYTIHSSLLKLKDLSEMCEDVGQCDLLMNEFKELSI